MRRLCILGAGGHGKVVLDAAMQMQCWYEYIFLDERYPQLTSTLGVRVVANIENYSSVLDANTDWIVAVGHAKTRQSISEKIMQNFGAPVTIVHPHACVSKFAQLGSGTVVLAGAVINPGATVGKYCIINTCSSVDHDSILACAVHVCPGTRLGGNVSVGEASWLGIGASIKHSVNIGSKVVVGAGSTVISDIPNSTQVVGNPARQNKPKDNNS